MVVWVDGGTRLILARSKAAPLLGPRKLTSVALRLSMPLVTSTHLRINRSRDMQTQLHTTAMWDSLVRSKAAQESLSISSSPWSRTGARLSLRTVTDAPQRANVRRPRVDGALIGRSEIERAKTKCAKTKCAEILPSRVERRTRLVTRARESSALSVHGRQAKETGQDPEEVTECWR